MDNNIESFDDLLAEKRHKELIDILKNEAKIIA